MRVKPSIVAVALAVLTSGCYLGYATYRSKGGGTDATVGEEHTVKYQAADAFQLVEDVLRGDGILFEVQPDNQVLTFWRPADNPPNFFAGFIGVKPRYRYQIQVLPEGANSSKIVANVQTEDVPDDQVDKYTAGTRIDFFGKLEKLAAELPPGPRTPMSGGVNFALLPHEDLRGLAKRVTGSADNWKEIAQDNGISSASEVSDFQTIWVKNSLLKSKAQSGQ